MIRTQRDYSDACPNMAAGDCCIFLETWDDASDEVSRVHSFQSVERLCSAHAGLAPLAAYNATYEERWRKEKTREIANSVKPISQDQFKWSFSGSGDSRVLTVTLGNLFTNQQKTQVQNSANVQFGPSKVTIV